MTVNFRKTIWMRFAIVGAALLLVGGSWLLSTESVLAGRIFSRLNASGAPTVVSYQGQVSVSGIAYSGTGYFKFAFVDLGGATTSWSNDGTAVDGAEPSNAVAIPVSSGLFEVLLGDTSMPNMTQPLTASVIDRSGCYLRVWFSPSGEDGSFTQLAPDQQVAAVPYSLQADVAVTTDNADRLDGRDGSEYQLVISGDCGEGRAIRLIGSNGSVTCQTDNPNTYTAGNQLDLVGSEFVVVEGAGSTLNADTLDGQDSSVFQRRVDGNCAEGSAIQAVGSDGSVTCEAPEMRLRRGFITTDISGSISWETDDNDITTGADGLALIAFYSEHYDDDRNIVSNLNIVHCKNIDCSSLSRTIIDGGGVVGMYPSIAIGTDGLGLISYYDIANYDLKVAHCSNTACSSTTLATIDSADGAWRYSSIAIGTDGLGLISYFDGTNYDLKIAHCSDAACSSATTAIIDSAGDVGRYTSIAIGDDGLGLISYYNGINKDLKVAHCNDIACTSATTATIDSAEDSGMQTSITIGADGRGLISYVYKVDGWDNDYYVKVAHCNNTACSSATRTTYDTTDRYISPTSTSITTGADGLGLVSYFSNDEQHQYLTTLHCDNPGCTSATTSRLQLPTIIWTPFCSNTIGSDGMPLVAYLDQDALKVVHFGNIFGIPYFQRR
jgi:hypothetical protein